MEPENETHTHTKEKNNGVIKIICFSINKVSGIKDISF